MPSFDARLVDMTLDEYLNHPAVGSSSLVTFSRSRRLFHAQHVARTIADDESEALRLGSAFDCALLEPQNFERRFICAQRDDYRGKGAVKAWNERKARIAAVGAVPIRYADRGLVDAMVDAVRASNWNEMLSRPGVPQQTVLWTEFGVPCKARADWLGFGEPEDVVEVKSAIDPTPAGFEQAIRRHGYHMRAAHYEAGFTALFDRRPRYRILAVGKKPPHEVLLWRGQDASMAKASQYREHILSQLAECFVHDDWRNPWETEEQTFEVKPWEMNTEEETAPLTFGGVAMEI